MKEKEADSTSLSDWGLPGATSRQCIRPDEEERDNRGETWPCTHLVLPGTCRLGIARKYWQPTNLAQVDRPRLCSDRNDWTGQSNHDGRPRSVTVIRHGRSGHKRSREFLNVRFNELVKAVSIWLCRNGERLHGNASFAEK